MKLAVVGGGLAGLSVAWHALQKGHDVTLFDAVGIGAGASGVSTGLLYPCPGKTSSRSWRAREGMEATKILLIVAEDALGSAVASYTGIFRPAVTEEQKKDFRKNQDRDSIWTIVNVPGLKVGEGLWIESGITVFSRPYLQGLWMACEKKGAHYIQSRFSQKDGDPFDRVVLTTGAETVYFEECNHLRVRTAVGQSLVCELKRPLPFSLSSYGYMSVTEDSMLCQVGSTYEHTEIPDPQKAIALLEKVAPFYPEVLTLKIREIRAGKRIAPKEGHQPITAKVGPKTWVLTGLGSRGMLYHSLFGRDIGYE